MMRKLMPPIHIAIRATGGKINSDLIINFWRSQHGDHPIHGQWKSQQRGHRARAAPAGSIARGSRVDRNEIRLRRRPVRSVHRASRQ
ncbi:hypothetical protein SBA4_4720020 [Candidatus Sulfopaludibacter sp. SbA4]|nr:hypothetical protein SBA4_4720020 [Candidatus Sulfopaludibacter sp. SbA4]